MNKPLALTEPQWRALREMHWRGPQYASGPAALRVHNTLARKNLCEPVVVDGIDKFAITDSGRTAVDVKEAYLSEKAVGILRKLAADGVYAIPPRKHLRMSPAERELVSGSFAERVSFGALTITRHGKERAEKLEKTP